MRTLSLDRRPAHRQHGDMTEQIVRLHIALADTNPLIWRRVAFPADGNLKMLHDVIQAAMGWLDYHLWEFKAGGRLYGVKDPDWPSDDLSAAKSTKLKTLIDRGVRQFVYTYDMGDNWEHILTVEAVEDGDTGTQYPHTSMASAAPLLRIVAARQVLTASSKPLAAPSIPDTTTPSTGIRAATAKPLIQRR